jgi:hypothetical protein
MHVINKYVRRLVFFCEKSDALWHMYQRMWRNHGPGVRIWICCRTLSNLKVWSRRTLENVRTITQHPDRLLRNQCSSCTMVHCTLLERRKTIISWLVLAYFWNMVNDHPSTATSWVDARKPHVKKIIVNRRIFGFLVPSSEPSQSSTLSDMSSSKIPVNVITKHFTAYLLHKLVRRWKRRLSFLPIKYCEGINQDFRLPIFFQYTLSTIGAHKILKPYAYATILNPAWNEYPMILQVVALAFWGERGDTPTWDDLVHFSHKLYFRVAQTNISTETEMWAQMIIDPFKVPRSLRRSDNRATWGWFNFFFFVA